MAAEAVAEQDMTLIPRGEFTMGSHEHADEAAHQVVLDPYYIDKYEVSNARYKEFISAADIPPPRIGTIHGSASPINRWWA